MKFDQKLVNDIVSKNSLNFRIDHAKISITQFSVFENHEGESLKFSIKLFIKTTLDSKKLISPLYVMDTLTIGLDFDTNNHLLIFKDVFSVVKPEVFDFTSPLWHYVIFKISANIADRYLVENFPNFKLKDQIILTPAVGQYGNDWYLGISFQNEEDKMKYTSLHDVVSIFNGILLQYEKKAYDNLEPYLQR